MFMMVMSSKRQQHQLASSNSRLGKQAASDTDTAGALFESDRSGAGNSCQKSSASSNSSSSFDSTATLTNQNHSINSNSNNNNNNNSSSTVCSNKSSKSSSNETVICAKTSSNDDCLAPEEQLSSNNSNKQLKIESLDVPTTATASDCLEFQMNSKTVDIERRSKEGKEEEEELVDGNINAVDGKQQQRKFLKNFLLFTNYLRNPFGNSSNNNNQTIESQQKKNNSTNKRASVAEIVTDTKTATTSSAENGDQQQQQQRSSFHLNLLLNFAQKYFGRNSSSAQSNNNQQFVYCSKSAPTTPIKSFHNSDHHQSLPNGHYSSGNRATIVTGEIGDPSSSSSTFKRPSVRFVECFQDDDDDDHEKGRNKNNNNLKYTDCGSQTIGNIDCRVKSNYHHQLEGDGGSLDGIDLVARLFKFPSSEQLHEQCKDSSEQQQQQAASGEVPMSSERFRKYGYSLIDYISNYLDTINKRRVTPLNIEPGYLKSLIQPSAPEKGESFAKIMHDFEAHIMCGITHWQHPHFHAYFPAGNAYPSILADMLSDALGCVGFSWAASPAYTELEIIMLDWMGKMIGLPDDFLCLSGSAAAAAAAENNNNNNNDTNDNENENHGQVDEDEGGASASKGGGVIQGSASECVLVNLLAARHWAIEKLRLKYPQCSDDGILLSKLIGYCSKEAHSCVEKAAMIGFIRMRALDTDDKHSLRGETLERALIQDIQAGLEPFFVCATLGTTSCVSFDNLAELGLVCKKYENIWLHVDAAYAGSALICPEFKYLMKGIEHVTSINMNPNKWMLINFDCSLMWVKDRFKLTRAFVVDPLYLQHSYSDQAIDYRHWGIPLSRRFRALKLWFVIRNYGLSGLQAYIRNHVRLAKLFESLILSDSRFSINNQVVLGLVCFRLIGSNALNQRLLSMINASGMLHMVPASLNGRYVIRFCVCDKEAKDEDIHYAYKCISEFATELLESIRAGRERIRAISQQNTIDVSSVSIHTQQSVSADPMESYHNKAKKSLSSASSSSLINAAGPAHPVPSDVNNNNIEKQNDQQLSASIIAQPPLVGRQQPEAASLMSSREAARQYLLANSTKASNHLDRLQSAKSPPQQLTKQTSLGFNNNNNNNIETDEDLEQSIRLDSMACTIDGYDDLDDLDDEFLDPPFYNSNSCSAVTTTNLAGTDSAQVNGADQSTTPLAGEGAQPSGANKTANKVGEHEEAADEVFNLAKRRNRMSLRYKREFFVRVVSDPRVYRASISGDINNARSSTTSLSGNNQQHQQQQSNANANANAISNTNAANASTTSTGGNSSNNAASLVKRNAQPSSTTTETSSMDQQQQQQQQQSSR